MQIKSLLLLLLLYHDLAKSGRNLELGAEHFSGHQQCQSVEVT